MRGDDLLEVKLSEKISFRQRVQVAGGKEYRLLNRGLSLSEVHFGGEHFSYIYS